eukprot:s1190_g28.t1
MCGRPAVAECGWKLRLGSHMMVKALMFLNKLLLFPSSHPIKKLVHRAFALPCDTWVSRVLSLAKDPKLNELLPTIWDSGLFPTGILETACSDIAVRKNVLAHFKDKLVFNAFRRMDEKTFREAAERNLLDVKLSWRRVRIWWLVRLTGLWPAPLFTTGPLLHSLPECFLCKREGIPIKHVLGEQPCEDATPDELMELFRRHSPDDTRSNILFVAERVEQHIHQLIASG